MPDNRQNSNLVSFVWFSLTTLLLCWPAFYNGYPLVFSDSGTYMTSSFSLVPPVDRPIGYGFFIRIVTWQATMWTVVIAQNALVNFLLLQTFKQLFGSHQRYVHLLGVIVLAGTSSLCWYSCQVMPDIFTGILLLSVFLFWQSDRKLLQTVYMLFVFGAIISHFSNFIILAFVMVLFLVTVTILYGRTYLRKHLAKLITLSFACLAGLLFLCANHAYHGKGFRLSLSSNVFITARLSESGILKKYLDDNCSAKKISLCASRDSLPTNTAAFLWDNNSVLYRYGGWEKANEEYQPIVRAVFTEWPYLQLFLAESWRATLQQCTELRVGSGLSAYGVDAAPYFPIYAHLPNELNAYLNSKQQQDNLNLSWYNFINYPLLLLSLVIVITSLFVVRNKNLLVLVLLSCFCFFCNAAVTASLANVYDRLQARISWLLVLAGFAGAVALYKHLKNNKSMPRTL